MTKILEATVFLPTGPEKHTGATVAAVAFQPEPAIAVVRGDGRIERYYGVPFSVVLDESPIIPATFGVVPPT